MWPFKTRKSDSINDGHIAFTVVSQIRAFRNVGETFNYLGRTCIVTGHYETYPYVGIVPMLKFDYVDDHGVIHARSASITELPAFINQQICDKPNNPGK